MLDPSTFKIAPEQCTLSTCGLEEAQINYIPSLPGNSAFLAIFAILLIVHTVQGIRYRTWGILVGMAIGLFLEVVGYAGRIQMHFNPFKSAHFTMQFICITIAPAFLSASIYLCLARIVIVHGASHSRLRPRTYSILLSSCDFLSLLLQSIGGAITSTAKTEKVSNKGIHIMIGGLAFQVFSLILFMSLWTEFNIRKSKAPPNEKIASDSAGETDFTVLRTQWKFKAFQIALWTAAACIFIRSIYRLVELHAGFTNGVANDEPAFMVLEGPMIIVASMALALFHPGFAFSGQWADASWSFREKKEINGV